MKIYLIDDKKIDKHVLPTKIDSAFLMHYTSFDDNDDSIITIEAENNQWLLKSNGNMNVVINQEAVEEVPLVEYSFYYLKIIGQSKYLLLYVAPSIENELYTLDYTKLSNITIGSESGCNILYQNELTDNIQCEIKKVENKWKLVSKSQKIGTYVNNSIVTSCDLNNGDLIFINGLKIIWMDKFIKINNPNNKVTVNELTPYTITEKENNAEYNEVDDEQSSIDLYKEDDYFFHTPRMREKIEHIDMKIDAPPSKDSQEDLPFLLSIGTSLTMVASSFVTGYYVFNGISSGKRTWLDSLPQVVMIVAMVIGSLIIPKLMDRYNRKKREAREKVRQEKYLTYLKQKKDKIEQTMKQQSLILYANNLSPYECANLILKNDNRLWNRQINDNDFIEVRLGIGDKNTDITIQAPEEHFTLDEDNLFETVYKIVDETKILRDVPITFSFADKNNVSFIFNRKSREKYIDGLITELIAFHSASDLKIIILTNKKSEKNWEFAKFLPHCWSDNKSIRFFATNQEELQSIASYLEEELKKRKEKIKDAGKDKEGVEELKKESGFRNFAPYYLIFCDNYKTIKKESIVDMILKNKENLGFSFVTIANSMRDLPSSCETFIEIGEKDGCILGKEIDSQTQTRFRLDAIPDLNMRELSVKLSNIPIISKDELAGLPNSIPFLEMYNVSKVEQLNALNRWKTNNPVVSLAAPVGVKTNGELFMLDLHEKFHGPHGLIAGSTGSGKSEFIITYILSMAANYHPYEVQFVLIDYKGGGLTGAFENKETGVHIPHLAGTITNLDTSEMNRTLVSIESELKRRQRIFNEVKDSLDESTINIYKYQKLYREGVVKEPLAHLFIISDEFAELKSQRPEFMDQLITTARIGRSLGLHLILATQKPSGVVNDQIWSNSKFKVCLKVQDRSDSMEMLKKPDAASLKEIGRFYLQVGYDDYFDIGQSAWSGAKYVPSNRILKKVEDSINFVNNVGYVIKTINNVQKEVAKKDSSENLGDQLTNIVKYIYNLSLNENIKTKKLWLDIIPGEIYISNLISKYGYKPTPYFINPLIGEYDKPKKQEQGLLNLDLTNGGNTIIYGQSGSGKEMLISTIIWSSVTEHTPEEVNFYIIDCGAETLKMFNKIPHIGEVATVDDGEKIANIFMMVDNELKSRKELFSDYSGSYINYCENSGQKLPLIVVVINGYDVFSETYGKLSEGVQPMYRECSKYGIIFIISTSTTTGVRSRMAQNFSNKIALQLPNDDDYRVVIQGTPRELIPGKYTGRGIIDKNDEVFEFQTAYIYNKNQINNIVRQATDVLNKTYKERAKKIMVVPSVVTLDLVINEVEGLDNIPIGYNIATKDIYKYNFSENNVNMILSDVIDEKIPFIYAIAKEIKKVANVIVIDFRNLFNTTIDGIQCFKKDFDNLLIAINDEIKKDDSKTNKNVYMMIGLGSYINKMNPGMKPIVKDIFNNVSTLKNNIFILVDDYASYKNIQLEQWYSTQVNTSTGIWLGEGIGSQVAINIANLSMEERKQNFAYMGFAVRKGKLMTIKCVFDGEKQNEE